MTPSSPAARSTQRRHPLILPAADNWRCYKTGRFACSSTIMNLTVKDPPLVLRRAWFVIGWIGVALVIYLSLTPIRPQLDIAHGDKLQHMAAYGALMLWFGQVIVTPTQRLWSAIALVALGVGLEMLQLVTGYRSCSYTDMAAGAVGVSAGWASAPPRLPSLLSIAERIAVQLSHR